MTIFAIASNNAGRYVAVGSDETILVSIDGGASWWPPPNQPGTGKTLYGVAFGEIQDPDNPGGYLMSVVAVGADGTILITYNFSDWFEVDSGVSETLLDVEFWGSYIAVGVGGVMVASYDLGENWQEKDSGVTEDLYDISLDNDTYVIIGANETIIVGQIDVEDQEREKREKFSATDSAEATVRYDMAVVADVSGYGTCAGRAASQAAKFSVGGTVEAGDTYTITLTLPNGTPVDYQYVVGDHNHSADSVTTTTGTQTGTIADAQASDGTSLIIDEAIGAGGGFHLEFAFSGVSATATELHIDGSYRPSSSLHTVTVYAYDYNTLTLDALGTIPASDADANYAYTLTSADHIDGSGNALIVIDHPSPGVAGHQLQIDSIHIVQPAVTADDVASSLAEIITASSDFSATAIGADIYVISTDPSNIFTFSSSATNGGATDDQTLDAVKTSEAAIQQVKFSADDAIEGNTYSITVGGDTFNYVAQAGDTQDIIAEELAALVDASGNWTAVVDTSGAVDEVVIWSETGYEEFTYTTSDNVTDELYLTGTEGFSFQLYEQAIESVDSYVSETLVGVYYNVEVINYVNNLQMFSNLLRAAAAVLDPTYWSDSISMRYAYIGEIIDAGYFGDTLTALEVEVVKEIVSALGSASLNSKLSREWTDSVTFNSIAAAALSILVAEGFDATSSAASGTVLVSDVVDRLYSSGVADSLMTAIIAVAEAVATIELVSSGYGVDVTDGVDSTTAIAELVTKYAEAIEDAVMSGAPVGSIRFSIPITSRLSIYDSLAPSAVLASAIAEGLMFAVNFGIDDTTYSGWVMNSRNFMVSEFQDYPFDSFAWVGGKPVGINSSGIYVLEGDTDAGAPIAAKLMTGLSNLGTSNLKNVTDIFLGFRGNGDILLKTVTKEEVVRWYKLRADGSGMHERRVKCGRGVKSTYWAVELENVDGSDFDIDIMELYPIVMSRKLGG